MRVINNLVNMDLDIKIDGIDNTDILIRNKAMDRVESINRIRMPRSHEIKYESQRLSLEQSQCEDIKTYTEICSRCGSDIPLELLTKDEECLCIKCKLEISIDKEVDDILLHLEWNELYAREKMSLNKSKSFSVKKKYGSKITEEETILRDTPVNDSVDNVVSIKINNLKKERIYNPISSKSLNTTSVKHSINNIQNEETKNFVIHDGKDLSSFYNIDKVIGSGKFGKVHKIVNRLSGKVAAAKEIPYSSKNAKDTISDEIEILKHLSGSDHVVNLIEVWDCYHTTPKKIILITEYLDGGDLFYEITKEDILSENEIIRILKQILEGVSFIHNRGIIHRDLKPENIMYQSKEIQKIKIIDFGLAVRYDENNPPRSMVGTTIFVAPEVLNFEDQSYNTDIWSIGVLAFDLLAGITPFEIPTSGDIERVLSDNEIMKNIQCCQYNFDDDGFIGVSNEAKDFISSILLKNPKERLTSDQCLNHPWLNTVSQKEKKTLIRKMSVMRMKSYLTLNK